jgi:hypothetical protein
MELQDLIINPSDKNTNFSEFILASFQKKGWALYPAKKSLIELKNLSKTICNGREKVSLKKNMRYAIFPLVQEDKNISEIIKAMDEGYMPPCFTEFNLGENGSTPMEMLSKGEYPKPIAVHPLDSLKIQKNNLIFIIDKRLYEKINAINPYPFLEAPCIEIKNKNIPSAMASINNYRTKRELIEKYSIKIN